VRGGSPFYRISENQRALLAAAAAFAATGDGNKTEGGAKGIHMPTETLEAILKECQRLGVKAVGFDEL